MHHMDCIIEIKGILCTGGKASFFRKSQLSKTLPVLGVGIAV